MKGAGTMSQSLRGAWFFETAGATPRTSRGSSRGTTLGAALLLAGLSACGDGDTTDTTLAPLAPANPAYAIMYEVYDDSGASASYLSLLDTLDIEAVDTATS